MTPLVVALTFALAGDTLGCDAVLTSGSLVPCVLCPTPCAKFVDESSPSRGSCRERDWSCFDDPLKSCAALVWAPARIAVFVAVTPLLLMKPKCSGPGPDVGALVLFALFGQPPQVCPRRSPKARSVALRPAVSDPAMIW